MKSILLFSLVFLPVFSTFSQEFKPLLDPSLACSYAFGNTNDPTGPKANFYHIVETMPDPILPSPSLEKLLKKNVNTKGIRSAKTMFQFLVNCEGKAGDYQFLICKPETAQFCKEVLDVFQNSVEWNPGIQKGDAVDVLLRMEVEVNNGIFKVKY